MKNLEKIIIVLLIILAIILFLNNSFRNFVNDELSIKSRIGNEMNTSALSTSEYAKFLETTVGVYIKKLENKEYEKAYQMLSPEYKKIVSVEEYTNEMKNIDFSNHQIESVMHRTQNMYVTTVITSDGVSRPILTVIDEEKFMIVPEPFLDYVKTDTSINKDKVKYILVGYTINLDNCIFDLEIINNKKSDINISNARIKNSIGSTLSSKNINITIPANSTQKVSVELETSLDFPKLFEIDRVEENQIRTYSFEL